MGLSSKESDLFNEPDLLHVLVGHCLDMVPVPHGHIDVLVPQPLSNNRHGHVVEEGRRRERVAETVGAYSLTRVALYVELLEELIDVLADIALLKARPIPCLKDMPRLGKVAATPLDDQGRLFMDRNPP